MTGISHKNETAVRITIVDADGVPMNSASLLVDDQGLQVLHMLVHKMRGSRHYLNIQTAKVTW